MTPQEFTNLTGVEVSAHEFEAIHHVYMASDYDKVQFCAAWCKMNKSRVERARKERQAAKKHQAIMDVVYEVMGRLTYLPGDDWSRDAACVLTPKQAEALMAIGISLDGVNAEGIHYAKSCLDINFELMKLTNHLAAR